MNFRIHTILYFATGIVFIALETIGVAWISIAVKSLIIPLLIWLYLRFVRGHWNRFHSMIIIALIFSWIGDITLQLTQFKESFFLIGVGCFLIAQLIYMVTFFTTPGENSVFFRKIYLVVPVVLYGMGILWLLYDGLVIMTMLLAAINREKKVNKQSFLLVLAGAIIFVVSDSILAINKFAQPFELGRIASMTSYITAQYLIALGCARQFNLTLK